MRVLMILGDMRSGGQTTTALNAAAGLQQCGWDVTVAGVREEGGAGKQFRRAGARVYEGVAAGPDDRLAGLRMRQVVKEERPRAILTFGDDADALRCGATAGLLRLRRTARVCLLTCPDDAICGSSALSCGLKRRRFDIVACGSRWARGRLISAGLPRPRLALVRPGIDVDTFASAEPAALPVGPARKVFLTVANAGENKDFPTLLEAAEILKDRRDDVRIFMAGRGTMHADVVQEVSRRQIGSTVSLLGYRPDVNRLLALARAAVLPLSGPAGTTAAIEAMAAGKPLIYSYLPHLEEFLDDDRQGLKVPPAQPDALAEAIETLADDYELCVDLGSQAQARALLYNRRRLAESLERLFRVL